MREAGCQRSNFPKGCVHGCRACRSRLATTTLGLRRQAPGVGEYTVEILQEAGLGRGEIDQLINLGVVSRTPALR